jgi:hypothetical protein
MDTLFHGFLSRVRERGSESLLGFDPRSLSGIER